MKKWFLSGIASGLGIFSAAALALGLGNVVVESNLNEPLRAQIPLVTRNGEDISEVEVSLASAEDFERVGLDRSLLAVPLNFVLDSSGGETVIRVTSAQSVRDPFLNFLIEVNWPRGRLLREYTLLLDPPVLAPSVAESSAAPVSTSSLPVGDEVPPVDESMAMDVEPAESEATSDPVDSEPSYSRSAYSSSDYGPVAKGETLWEIADQMRPEGTSVQEMMLALLRANPEAFGDANINYLKRGSVLRMPTDNEINGMSRAEIVAQIQTQNELWDAYRQRVSGNVSQVADAASGSSFGSSTASSDDSGSRLELVAPENDSMGANDSSGSGADSMAGLRSQLDRAREDLANSGAENAELDSRVTELEGLVRELERVVAVKDSDLAQLQSRLGEDGAVPDEMTTALSGADGADAVNPDDPFGFGDIVEGEAGVDAMAGSLDGSTAGEDLVDASADAEDALTAAVDVPEEVQEPAVTPAPTNVVRRAPKPTLMERLMQWWLVPLGILVLGLLGGLLWWRGRSSSSDGSPVDLAVDDDLDNFAEDEPDFDDDSFADPDEDALLDDIAAQPDDPQRRLVLLRRYYADGDATKFEVQARALRDYVSGDDNPAWVETRTMGSRLIPGSALFAAAAAAADDGGVDFAEAPEIESDLDLDEPMANVADEAESSFPFDGPAESLEDASEGNDLDLDLDLDTDLDLNADSLDDDDLGLSLEPLESDDDATADILTDTSDLESAVPDAGLDLDLDNEVDAALDMDVDELPPLEFDMSDSSDGDSGDGDEVEAVGEAVDLDMDLDDGLDLGDIEFETDDAETLEVEGLSAQDDDVSASADFDATTEMPAIDLDDDELFEGEDTVGTKLDLAKAYIDMGDPDGARGMLEEVVAEGSEPQRDEAERLIGSLD